MKTQSKKLPLFFLLTVILVLNLAGLLLGEAGTNNEKQPEYESPFGIFGPYETFLDNPTTFTKSDINNYLKDLGVKWVQEMPRRNNLEIVSNSGANIYSRALPKIGTLRSRDFPYESYKENLRETIRRYKNQVKFWEADTEPFLPPRLGGWRGYPEEYAKYLKTTYEVIKEECSDCKVVFGGLGGGHIKIDENSPKVKFLRAVLGSGGARYFDIFEFKQHHHTVYEYIPFMKAKMEVYGKLLSEYNIDIKKMPLFIETAMYDGSPQDMVRGRFPEQSEQQQAVGVIKTYIYALSQGIDKIFWNYVLERSSRGKQTGVFQNYGLVHNPANDGKSHKKLAYYTYKKMVEILEGSDWNNIEIIKEEINDTYGIFLYKFLKKGKPIYVGWYDCYDEQKCSKIKINLQVKIVFENNAKQIKITEAVPKYKSGEDVKNYSKAFKTEIKHLFNGNTNITLSEVPIFVEEN